MAATTDAVEIRDVTQFLVDDTMLAATRGLTRRFHPATKHSAGRVLTQTEPWEGTYVAPATVAFDAGLGRWRMWYNSLGEITRGGRKGHRELLHSAVSSDGLEWEKLELGLTEVDGTRANNIVAFADGAPCPSGCRVFVEPEDPDPAKRYKLIYYLPNYHLAYSADGHTWRPAQQEPVWPNGSGDGLEETFFFLKDELIGKYRGYMRVWRRHQTIRKLSLGESDDLRTWSGPRIIWEAGPEFGDGAQIYGMNVFIDGGVYWGLIWMFYSDQPLDPAWQQTMRFKLAWSKDGRSWQSVAPEQDAVPMGGPGEFDSGMMLSNCPVVRVGDQYRLYYYGAATRHDSHDLRSAVGLATFRPGGFVSLGAGDAEGALVTRRFLFQGEELQVNARVADGGYLEAELLDDSGNRLAGYGFAESDRFTGDRTAHRLTWRGRGDLGWLVGQSLQLKLRLRRADLFAWRVAGAPERFRSGVGPRPVTCGRCAVAPVIDGVLSDQCWQDFTHSGVVDDFVLFDKVAAPTARTRVLMTYDDQNLYFGIDCEEPALAQVAAQSPADGAVGYPTHDCVEFRLSGPGHGTHFHQLVIAPNGARMHCWFSKEAGDARALDAIDWTAKTSQAPGHWYAELAVPFQALTSATPKAGERWKMHVIRYRHGAGEEWSSWVCLFGSVHRNDLAGPLVFGG